MGGTIEVGPLPVRAEAADVARFARAIRTSDAGVPATFAIRWLAHPTVRAALMSLARPGEIAVHEEQSFEWHAPVSCDALYALSARLERTDDPPRVVLAGRVCTGDHAVVTMRAVLRLFSAGPAVTPAPRPQVEQ